MVLNFAQLEPRTLSVAELPERTIAFNITQSVKRLAEQNDSDFVLTSAHVMACTQRSWKLNPQNANTVSLILATYSDSKRGKLILGAFKFDRDGADRFFHAGIGDEGRYGFLAEPADPKIWNQVVGHYLPKSQPGEANPVRYYDPE